MDRPQNVVVVIPTYNEAENLEALVTAVLAQDDRIRVLVVDDASPDGTGELADALEERTGRVNVLHREAKRGLGAAYRAGLRRALDAGADAVIQMDCDFSHPPDLLPHMLERIEHCDVAIGSRYINGITVVNWPIERILISYFGNWYARRVTGLTISDTTGGFRCVRRQVLESTVLTEQARRESVESRLADTEKKLVQASSIALEAAETSQKRAVAVERSGCCSVIEQ